MHARTQHSLQAKAECLYLVPVAAAARGGEQENLCILLLNDLRLSLTLNLGGGRVSRVKQLSWVELVPLNCFKILRLLQLDLWMSINRTDQKIFQVWLRLR